MSAIDGDLKQTGCHPEWSVVSKCFFRLANRTRGICSCCSSGWTRCVLLPRRTFERSLTDVGMTC